MQLNTQKFDLGQVVATPAALDRLQAAGHLADSLLRRHAAGDWGDLDPEDSALNDEALVEGSRILSAYVLSTDEKVWIITEHDRSVTTVLCPEDY